MKGFVRFISAFLAVTTTILEFLEYLVIPAFLVIIGLWNNFSWQYYVISISICIGFYVIVELIAYFVMRAIDKKYTSRIEKKLEKISVSFSKKN